MNYFRLLKRYLTMNVKELTVYKTAFALGLVADLSSLVVNFIFWDVIFSSTTQVNGWTFAQVLLVQGFFRLFIGFYWLAFNFSEHMDELIVHGKLDSFLSKPINPLAAYMMQKVDLFAIGDLLTAGAYFMVAAKLGVEVSLEGALAALIVCAMGTAILAMIFVTIGTLSFWVGRTQSIMHMWNSIWEFGAYPLTILPNAAQMILTFGIPLIFLQTYPALLTSGKATPELFMQMLLTEIALIAFWFLVMRFAWRKGLKRYSSYGG